MKQYSHLALGGTFDLLHRGHIDFLDFAFARADFVSIGLTSDMFAKELGKKPFLKFKDRFIDLEKYLNSKYFGKFKIITLSDVFGITIKDRTVDGLVATNSTLLGVDTINEKRVELGVEKLEILIFPMTLGNNKLPISSTLIRQGVINRAGENYYGKLSGYDFVLPHNLRKALGEPFGILFERTEDFLAKNGRMNKTLVSVGDVITSDFLRRGLVPNLAIVDLKNKRKPKYKNLWDLGFLDVKSLKKAINPPGKIHRKLIDAIFDFYNEKKDKHIIQVEGEEDLSVLPAVLMAPLGSFVLYGLANRGLVAIEVTEEIKKNFVELLEKFSRSKSI